MRAAPVVAAVVASAAGVVEAGEGAVVASAASTAAVVRETVLAFSRGRHHGSILPRAHPIERRNHGVHHQRRQQQKSQLPHDQGPHNVNRVHENPETFCTAKQDPAKMTHTKTALVRRG